MMNQNSIAIALAAVAGLSAIPSLGNLGNAAGNFQGLRQQARDANDRANELQLIQQEIEATAAIADARYEICIPVVDLPTGQSYVALVEGGAVLDSVTQRPLPAGAVVCDWHGMTALLVAGDDGIPVARHLAFTGDRAVVEARLANFRGATAFQPGL